MEDMKFVALSRNSGLISYKISEIGVSHGKEFNVQKPTRFLPSGPNAAATGSAYSARKPQLDKAIRTRETLSPNFPAGVYIIPSQSSLTLALKK